MNEYLDSIVDDRRYVFHSLRHEFADLDVDSFREIGRGGIEDVPVVGTTDVPIEAVAVLIRHLTSIGGPRLVSGPLQAYDVRALLGIATFDPA